MTEVLTSSRVRHRMSVLGLIREGVADLLSRRRLIAYLVGADLKRTHADTLFGQLWWILDPLLQMGIYFVLVQIIFQKSVPDYPLFLFAGILPWKWFVTTLGDATNSVTGRQNLLRQVQFPKIILPTAAVTASAVSFAIGMVALGLVYTFYLERLSFWVVFYPVIAFVQFVFTLALAVALSAVNAFYRDVSNVLTHATRLLFYLSPVLYSLDHINDKQARTLLSYNPFSALMTSYRNVTWGETAPDWIGLLIVLVASLVLFAAAIALFKRVEPAFARIL
jgi:ABC-type polysaccharide/polyol phosphate export permease